MKPKRQIVLLVTWLSLMVAGLIVLPTSSDREQVASARETRSVTSTSKPNAVIVDDRVHIERANRSAIAARVTTTVATTTIPPTTTTTHYHPPTTKKPASTIAPKTTEPVVVGNDSGGNDYQSAVASYYHLPGNTYANGEKYDSSLAFAHKTMAFGTKVEFCFNGKCAVGVCKDRGPFIAGRTFDLNLALADAVGLRGVQTVRWRQA